MENINTKEQNNTSLVDIVSTAIQVPGVKVNRDTFLMEQFKNVSKEDMELIIEKGPVEASRSRSELQKKAAKLIQERTLVSSGASFIAGVPGGLAMAATIPADMLQFYGVALRLAQELAYLYGEGDLWDEGTLDKERVTNQLIIYCGVMLGASGANQAVRVLSSSLAKQALKKIPQKALTKTFYYPIVKSIAKAFGAKMTKEVFAKGVSKAVPLIGGVVSGGITLATMLPMGNRLAKTLDEAHFDYSQAEFEADWKDIVEVYEAEEGSIDTIIEDVEIVKEVDVNECVNVVPETPATTSKPSDSSNTVVAKIRAAKELLDEGIITEEEFGEIKAKIIAEM